jgi:hypothetical protein
MKKQKTNERLQVTVFVRMWAVPAEWGFLRAFILEGRPN